VAPWHQLPQHIYTLVAENPGAILLETARCDTANQTSHLFLNPIQTLAAQKLEDLPKLFADIEAALTKGHHAAGYLSYECGYHFEHFDKIPTFNDETPLAWFGIYAQPITFNHATGTFTPEPSTPTSTAIETPSTQPFAENITLNISPDDYREKILKIKSLIAAGDTYQVNFTDTVKLNTTLDPAAAFSTLARQQPVSYAAFLNIAGQHILSLSPELFFKLNENKITTRPMKGTMPRGNDLEADALAALALQHDEKNRSEHIMIVDLLRNDLGRICTMGSVHVEDLFTIEHYETLLQMTSTVSGLVKPNLTFYEIFRALFPSGSITGAPKIRTMQIIRDLEQHPRGIYTGAIGHIAPNRSATFNVAIRTLTLNNGHATMGVGGGIVADSNPAAEYRECLLKASFLTHAPNDFQLIETILWNGDFYLLTQHLDRLAASAAYFNFTCEREVIITQLKSQAATFDPDTKYRVRLLLDAAGTTTITTTILNTQPTGLICLSTETTNSTDLFLHHKTTRRPLYDHLYKQAVAQNCDDIIFLNERNELTEGAISNIFLRKGNKLLTPPITSGVLPGIYRRHILETNSNAEEKVLTLEDLHTADAIYICNSVRGMNEVKLNTPVLSRPLN
jgi:para-aminobenzoate synthetase / 4-amino-4-deoxychorismate lyase